jgi:hypothetical protein
LKIYHEEGVTYSLAFQSSIEKAVETTGLKLGDISPYPGLEYRVINFVLRQILTLTAKDYRSYFGLWQ